MSDGVNDSAFPNRPGHKSTFHIDGSAYKGLGLSQYDVGDDLVITIIGKVKGKSENPIEDSAIDLVIRVDEIKDNTPRSDRDSDNRLL